MILKIETTDKRSEETDIAVSENSVYHAIKFIFIANTLLLFEDLFNQTSCVFYFNLVQCNKDKYFLIMTSK